MLVLVSDNAYLYAITSKSSHYFLVYFTGIAAGGIFLNIDILRRLRDAVRRKRPGKGGPDIWFPLHDYAPAHLSVFVKDFLAKNNVATQEHSPYSPNLYQADFYRFPPFKSALKGRRFGGVTDIIKNATEELKRFS